MEQMMRILIVGAGIAGLTLTALLNKRGINPRVIEKAAHFSKIGYMLGIYPFGSNILHGLNCYDTFLKESAPVREYEAYALSGKLLKSLSLAALSQGYGQYQTISRYQLLDILTNACNSEVEFDTTITSLTQTPNEVEVTFNDGSQATFDLIIGADGIHSSVREMILTSGEVNTYDTGWGGWVWWSECNDYPKELIREYWGTGSFFGIYPVQGKLGLIAALPRREAHVALDTLSPKEFILNTFLDLSKQHQAFFEAIPSDKEKLFFWPLYDKQAARWNNGRVLLLGDSACAFLPTAGVGASMAMGSAAVLNDILSRTDATTLPKAIEFFVKRRKKRVELAQADSRRLAKLMFVSSNAASCLRNISLQYMSAKSVIKSIMKDFDSPL